ncbi:sarcosine oxidase subunit delta family protein [Sphingomonas populi]|uniref:Sarcosine oxidase subunit delta family protein n=1 Tax=Sphingomonas populi TaxID=2484750 RepID=A0A4Q6Y435_9SPHN|nr:sarcosine oxidase subunit delta [Sphingomonas populi]RZF63886.1 sarcosine oxidase subunit delta family protein [Sphingomonas populi]
MLLIHCPWCGPREELEFRCGGESHISRPSPSATVSDTDWGNYLFTRKNPKGVHYERWVHAFGCRRWFNVARHTATHRIEAIYAMHEAAPSAFDGADAL